MSEKIQVMREIADWVKQYGWQPYFNQKNTDNYPQFHANTNSKPDLLLQKNQYNILVEIKTGQDHQDILNGVDQTWRYAGEYYSGRAIYTIDNEKITIDAITLATKFSKSGFLYIKESNVNYLEYSYLTETYHMIEKPITHTTTRFLWRQWEKGFVLDYYEKLRQGITEQNIILPNKPRIGTLLAKIQSENRQITTMPYLYLNSNNFVPMGCGKIESFNRC